LQNYDHERIVQNLVSFTRLSQARLVATETSERPIRAGVLETSVLFCDGTFLAGRWHFDGSQDYVLPKHRHKESTEIIGLMSGGPVGVYISQVGTLNLRVPVDIVRVKPNAEHCVRFQKGKHASGFFLVIPPEYEHIQGCNGPDACDQCTLYRKFIGHA